jgi:hypothetical protein
VTKAFFFFVGSALSVALFGCAGLTLTTIKTAEQRPSNVAIYFKVQTEGGNPVGGLTADRFRIYEDGQLVSVYESKQTILNPAVAAVHYTLLLVDMSGSVSESGSAEALVRAVTAFTDRVEKDERVGIYAFDGSPDLYPIVSFTDQPGSTKTGLNQLATFKPKDPSTNLNGAVIKALDQLDTTLGNAHQPLRFGTLVVFTDGTDRANRVPESAMLQHIRDKPFDVFAIGLGAEIKPSQLEAIGKSGTAMAENQAAIVKAFDQVGAKVDERTKSFYLLSYCSPSRAGKHEVRIEATLKDAAGHDEGKGSIVSDFDATSFAPGCDPNTPPSFDVTKGDTLAPPPPTEHVSPDKDERKARKTMAHKASPAKSPPSSPSSTPPPISAPPSSPAPAARTPQDFNP